MNGLDKNGYEAKREAEEDALHTRNVVPVILLADAMVVVTVICLAAVLFTVLFAR